MKWGATELLHTWNPCSHNMICPQLYHVSLLCPHDSNSACHSWVHCVSLTFPSPLPRGGVGRISYLQNQGQCSGGGPGVSTLPHFRVPSRRKPCCQVGRTVPCVDTSFSPVPLSPPPHTHPVCLLSQPPPSSLWGL